MNKLLLLFLPLALLASTHTERIASDLYTAKAWRLDTVGAINGELDDPTGVMVSQADAAYLAAVEAAISELHVAGTNGYARATNEFWQVYNANKPLYPTFFQLDFPPYSTLNPSDRNGYGFLAAEIYTPTTNEMWIYLSQPYTLEPKISCQDIYVSANSVVTNYNTGVFVDYYNDATNFPAHATNGYPRCVRFVPPAPALSTPLTIISDPHLHFGVPDIGLSLGSMGIGVNDNGTVKYGITGVYTDRTHRVTFEIKKGAIIKSETY